MANLSPEDISAIKQSANRLGLDPYSFGAIIQQESGFRMFGAAPMVNIMV